MSMVQYVENLAPNLPNREREILVDMVVNCSTISDLVEYKNSLTQRDKKRFESLIMLLDLERIDSTVNNMESFPDAIDIIAKVMYDKKK
jgi:hypothetical protein